MKNDPGTRRPGKGQRIAISTSAAPAAAVGNFCTWVRIAADTAVYYKVGATATLADSAYLPAQWVDFVKVNGGEVISFITATGTGFANVVEME